jgi:thiamine kinase-like enzyme
LKQYLIQATNSKHNKTDIIRPSKPANHKNTTVYGKDLNASDMLVHQASSALKNKLQTRFSLGQIDSVSYPPHVTTTSKKAILNLNKGERVFVKEKAFYCKDVESATSSGNFQNYLASNIDCVPRLLLDDSKSYTVINGETYVAMEYKKGRPFSGKRHELKSAARTLARLHNLSIDYPSKQLQAKNSIEDALYFIDLSGQLEGAETAPGKLKVVSKLKLLVKIKSKHYSPSNKLVYITTHGDFTPSNILFDTLGEVSAITDFDNCGMNMRIRDLAESIMTFCGGVNYLGLTSSLRTPISEKINQELYSIFIAEYKGSLKTPLKKVELRHLNSEIIIAWSELMALGIVRGDFNYLDVLKAIDGFVGCVESLKVIDYD